MKKTYLAVNLLILLSTMTFLCAFTKSGRNLGLEGHKNTMHFSVWASSRMDAERVAKELESYYSSFLSDLKYGGMLKKKPEVYVFKNQQEYIDKTRVLGYNTAHTGGIAVPRSARRPAEIYFYMSSSLIDVLRHELTHLIFKEITAGLKTDARMPIWLTEGLATYQEKGNWYSKAIRAAFQNDQLIPIRELTGYVSYPEDANRRALFYAQSASLVDFLINEYGGAKFLAFSRKLVSGGKDIDKALSSTYYPHIRNVSEFSDTWSKFHKR